MLLEQLKTDNEVDTTKVQWKGYNSDGLPVVKNGAKTEVADGQGLISNNQNKNMIYDRSGSVEYPRRKELITPRYQKKPLQIERPRAAKKKVGAQIPTSGSEFALAIIKKNVAIDVICIAVIDENNDRNTDTAWAAFREAYPQRRFFLLQPNTNFGVLYVPPAFSSDDRATYQTVSVDPAVSDWYTISGLNNEAPGAQCILFIDQSGSMTINTVLDSYLLFKSKAIERSNKVAVVDNSSEDYIAPFYISDDYFNVANYQSNWPQ